MVPLTAAAVAVIVTLAPGARIVRFGGEVILTMGGALLIGDVMDTEGERPTITVMGVEVELKPRLSNAIACSVFVVPAPGAVQALVYGTELTDANTTLLVVKTTLVTFPSASAVAATRARFAPVATTVLLVGSTICTAGLLL